MTSGAITVALSWMRIRMRCPIFQMPLSELNDKITEINGLTLQQPFFEHVSLCLIIIDDPWQIEYGLTSSRHTVSTVACQLIRSF